VALGKFMRLLLIALDICLLAYIISQMIYRILPVAEPFFWVAAIIETGLAWIAYRYWMRSLSSHSWNHEKTLSVVLILVAAVWPSLIRYTDSRLLLPAAPADILFFFAALTLLIYSSFVIKPPSKADKHRR
jgi:hypothetical protein